MLLYALTEGKELKMFKKYTRGAIKKIDQLKKKNKGIFYSFIRLL